MDDKPLKTKTEELFVDTTLLCERCSVFRNRIYEYSKDEIIYMFDEGAHVNKFNIVNIMMMYNK